MSREHQQIEWNADVEEDLRKLIQLTVVEDLGQGQDWTTVSLVPSSVTAEAAVVSREAGVIAGMHIGSIVLDEMECSATFQAEVNDGDSVKPSDTVAILKGPARELLSAERTILNFVGYLSGIATLASKFVALTEGHQARIYDTRKTLPGYRRLAKYAVRCGGGTNHRCGLHRAVLIKDNHIAFGNAELADNDEVPGFGVGEAVTLSRDFVVETVEQGAEMIIEIEVDTLDQLAKVLPSQPDIVLLDNMTTDQLRKAVSMRDDGFAKVQLEASGGVNLSTVAGIAATGVDRISVGALTHSVTNFDVGLDWR